MTNRVTLLHNPGAGFEQFSKEEILKSLQKKGYKTLYADVKAEDLQEKLNHPADLLVIAGGDGTVIKIARQILEKNLPIGLLPVGTANNIASALGIKGKPEDIISGWDLNRKKKFDLGLTKGPQGENVFFESCGFGLLPRLIRQHTNNKKESSGREEELDKALRHQQDILKKYKPHHCKIELDGRTIQGKYLLVEIMNIPLAGPNMDLAPEADPGDGFLDVVLVREDEREKFARHLNNQISGKEQAEDLNVLRAKNLKVEWEGIHYHLDDEAFEKESPVKVEIELLPEKLDFLVVEP